MTWQSAFLQQARSDLDVYEFLSEKSAFPACHHLHYLQMWLEKLCKASMVSNVSEPPPFVHRTVEKVLPTLLAAPLRRVAAEADRSTQELRRLCREIDRLHPQVDDSGRRHDNAEYPWLDSGVIYVPSLWKFKLAKDLYSKSGRLLIKTAAELTRSPLSPSR